MAMKSNFVTSVSGVLFTVAVFAGVLAAPAMAVDRFAKSAKTGLAIKGYDTTAYHSIGKLKRGNKTFVVAWKGAKWHFANADDAAKFQSRPEAYAPQFGAYCTRAMSKGIVLAAKPHIWRMHKDKLYMFYAPIGGEKFDEGADAMIAKAQANWDKLELSE